MWDLIVTALLPAHSFYFHFETFLCNITVDALRQQPTQFHLFIGWRNANVLNISDSFSLAKQFQTQIKMTLKIIQNKEKLLMTVSGRN